VITPSKFGRIYQLDIQTASGAILPVQLPFTVEFDVSRQIMSDSNTATIRVYNLSQDHRSQIRKNIQDFLSLRTISFRAGYGTKLSMAFTGNIQQAFSVREGVDFISQIEAYDWGFAFVNSEYSRSFGPGFTQEQIIADMVTQTQANVQALALPGTSINFSLGAIGQGYDVPTRRANSYDGNSADLIRQLTGSSFFVDNGVANVLGVNECLPAEDITVIDASAGLLNTPVLEDSILHFEMLFEPRLVIGQAIQLISETEPELSGQYKVVSINHKGLISDAVCGDAVTSVGLFAPLLGESLSVLGET
jgi:hypothetical protein